MADEREAALVRFNLLKKGRPRWQMGRLMRIAHPGHDYRRCTIGRLKEVWFEWSEDKRKHCEQVARDIASVGRT